MEKLKQGSAKYYTELEQEDEQDDVASFQLYSQIKAFNDAANCSMIGFWSFNICILMTGLKFLIDGEGAWVRLGLICLCAVLLKISEKLGNEALPLIRNGRKVSLPKSSSIFLSNFLTFVVSSLLFLYLFISKIF